MPRIYEQMRDKFIRQGMSDSGAKRKAARIYNSQHPTNPVASKHKAASRGKR